MKIRAATNHGRNIHRTEWNEHGAAVRLDPLNVSDRVYFFAVYFTKLAMCHPLVLHSERIAALNNRVSRAKCATIKRQRDLRYGVLLVPN